MSPDQPDRNRIAHDLAVLVSNLQHTDSAVEEGLIELVASAQRQVTGARYAGITKTEADHTVDTVAATHHYAGDLDVIQARHRQGPCVSAAWDHHTVLIDDVVEDKRWPRFRADVIATTPIRSIMSFEVAVNQTASTALNFYAETAHAFNEDALEVGLIFATNIALAWSMMRRGDQFRSALASRDIIGQAKGMIMERYRLNAVQAFALLKRLSQSSNAKLVDIATQLVESENLG